MRDVSGPHGPKEYNVVVSAALHKLPRVVVEAKGADLYDTMRYVARRAKRTVERAIRRGHRHTTETVRRLPVVDEAPSPLVEGEF